VYNLPGSGTRIGDRYVVDAFIGRGGVGAVFSGHDAFLERPVAIKLLGAVTADPAIRLHFLNEGKVLARVMHESCVRIFDTGVDAQWGPFLVMERLMGRDLAAFLKERGPLPVPLALALAEQLCGAVQAVHDAGIIHRDLKPANVFVLDNDPAGLPLTLPRIKLLDFGIAVLTEGSKRTETPSDGLGTLAYMAPERWALHDAGKLGADIYSLGAIVYELLSGSAPFRAGSRAALKLAILNDPPPPLQSSRPDLPGWLIATIEQALRKAPHERPPSASAFARSLALKGAPELPKIERAEGERGPEHRAPPGPEVFVGRGDVFEALDGHVRDAAGGPRIVLVEGASGIGKTALLDEFRRRLEGTGRALVFAGRAREGESVPYPALGEIIEELASHLAELPAATVEALLPHRCGPLARLFPMLARVPAIARAVSSSIASATDAAQARRQAFALLRDLLWRLCGGRRLVVLIDDLQWIDSDSAALLGNLLGGYDPPPLLLVGGVRVNESEVVPAELHRLKVGLAHAVEHLRLGPLSHGEARTLVRACVSHEKLDLRTTARLSRQSGGVPFFVVLLAAGLARGDTVPARLETFLVERARSLPAPARAALQLLCISSRPLPVSLVLETLGIKDVRDLDPLFVRSFVRWTRFHGRWAVEPYHNRIRETVRAELAPATLRRLHGDLVRQLQTDPSVDPEILVEHLAGSGDGPGAADIALRAARLANQQLAFDRAATLLAVAAEHGQHHGEAERLNVCRARVRALQNAGRRREAGEVLLRGLVHTSDPAAVRQLEIEAGGHLLLSGDVEHGLAVLSPALLRARLGVPTSFLETVGATTGALTALGARGLAVGGGEAQVASSDALERVDLCLLLAQGLAHIDFRAVLFACHGLHGALDAGDPERLQRACALFVINTVEYVPNPMVAPILGLCQSLTDANPRPLATALLETARAENAHFEGDFLTAEAALERAERLLLQACPGSTRELATVRDLAVFIHYAQKGDFRTQVGRTQRWLAQAEASGDAYHESMLRVAHAIVWIAHDDPVRARAELLRAQAGWKGDAGVLGVAAALYHDIIDRYEERDRALAASDNPMRSALLRSPAAQTPFLGGYLVLQDVWAALRAMADGRAGSAQAAEIKVQVDGLRKVGLELWAAVADALEGNLDYLDGEPERAVRLLGQSEASFRRLHMLCLAACARKRRGQLAGGEVGRRLEDEADAELAALGVANVERWTRAYWSMFDASALALRTHGGGEE